MRIKKYFTTGRHRKFLNSSRFITCMLLIVMCCTTMIGARPAKQDADFTLIIDAGHGGHDHGAIDNGAREKDINLGVSLKLRELIKKKLKNVKVVMTRDDDHFISLQERANIANWNKGNLFISIHTNSVDKSNPNRKKVTGASVYALGTHKSNDNLRVAQRENSVIELENDYKQKYSGFDPTKDESYIIFEMAQKKTLGQSLRFAEKAQKELVKSGRADRSVRQAGFWVLWATSMPAVLVELDFICNPDAASYMNSEKGQEELAQALFNAVELYVENSLRQMHQTKNAEPKSVNEQHDAVAYRAPILPQNPATVIPEQSLLFTASVNPGLPNEVGTLRTPRHNKEVKKHNAATPKPSVYRNTPRKRRSASSREISDNRNLETDAIEQRSESDYLLKDEKPQTEVEVTEPREENTKGKKKKAKKQKQPKQKASKEKKDSNKKKNEKGGKKTFIVRNQPSTPATGSATNVTRLTDDASGRPTFSAVKTQNGKVLKSTYKILLLSSPTELNPDDPAFQGIVPTGMFRENGQYKYTVHSSESRAEIEKKLLDIRQTLPEATIVVRME